MLDSDPVGRDLGTRRAARAPQTATWGWNAAAVGKTLTPTLMIAGQHDKQVPPDRRPRSLYARSGGRRRSCSSNPRLLVAQRRCGRRNRLLMFPRLARLADQADRPTAMKDGTLRLGY